MATYGTSPQDLAKVIKLDQSRKRDWSVDLLLALGTAVLALDELEKANPSSTYLNSKRLVADSLERAWREALFIRSKLPSDAFDDVERDILISKLGRVTVNETNDGRIRSGRSGNGTDSVDKADERVATKKRGARQFVRRERIKDS